MLPEFKDQKNYQFSLLMGVLALLMMCIAMVVPAKGAQLLLINETTNQADNNVGDVVGVFDDDYCLTGNGMTGFDVVSVPGTRKQAEDELEKLISAEIKTEMGKAKSTILTRATYNFKVVDDTQKTIAAMCVCNHTLKGQ